MNFSDITKITIPEGSVISIHHGDRQIWKKVLLPDGYQQLAYIETDGNQSIDTDVKAIDYPDENTVPL